MNTKMKALSLALVGLAGFAGSAMAACPAGPDIAHGGAWSGAPVFQGTVAISTPGLASTECKMDSAINASASGAAFATVEDDSPTAEPSYRASFIIDADTLTNQSLLQGVTIFSANSTANGKSVFFSIFGDGAGGRTLGYFVADSSQPSGLVSGAATLAAGENHVEFKLLTGASGAGNFTLWVNSNVEASPTIPAVAVTNDAYTVDTTFVGLAAPSTQYVTAFAGTAVSFDQFDSRRTLFIGY